jgi:hypothetical protein
LLYDMGRDPNPNRASPVPVTIVVSPVAPAYTVRMKYETWFSGNVRVVAKDPSMPIDAGGDYSNVELVQDGPPIAHAVAAGTSTPECGTTVRHSPRSEGLSHNRTGTALRLSCRNLPGGLCIG